MTVLDRLEDNFNRAWGVMGYNHMEAAQKQGQAVLDSSLNYIVERVDTQAAKQASFAAVVFNPCGWERTDVATTGRIYPIRGPAKGVVVKDRSGRIVPSQILKSEKDEQGNLLMANVAFRAENVPSVGYDTYYFEFVPQAAPAFASGLRVDEQRLELENEDLKVKLDATHGNVVSLFDKQTGRELLDGQKAPFPVFKGRANPDFPVRSPGLKKLFPHRDTIGPVAFDSAQAKAVVSWVEKGPLRATVKARYDWPVLKFETYTTVYAGLPYVEVTSRILADVPPAVDALQPNGRFPWDIQEGYWLTFAPAFQPSSILRDFPFAIEPTKERVFQALTLLDLAGPESGLLLLHAGTQYFNRDDAGIFSNLLMREWESYFSNEYGWPRYSQYRHALMPHGPSFTNAERLRAATEFAQKLTTVVREPRSGSLPARKGFVSVGPEGVQLSAFRKKEGRGYELRVVEVEGREAAAHIELALPLAGALETNLLGSKVGEVARTGNELSFNVHPWRVQTYEVF
jgi:alpha-mannosidase